MPAPRFVHLRLHSEYSVTDGIVRLDQAVSRAAADGMPVLVLCSSRAGYLRLCELLSRAWLGNQYRSRAEIARAWLEQGGTEGLIALSGAASGDVGQALAVDNAEAAERLARAWAELFPGRYYI